MSVRVDLTILPARSAGWKHLSRFSIAVVAVAICLFALLVWEVQVDFLFLVSTFLRWVKRA
jgi:hypothetical protein